MRDLPKPKPIGPFEAHHLGSATGKSQIIEADGTIRAIVHDSPRAAELFAAAPDLMASVAELLDHDGGEGAKCYHAMKLYDARLRLRTILLALNARPTRR